MNLPSPVLTIGGVPRALTAIAIGVALIATQANAKADDKVGDKDVALLDPALRAEAKLHFSRAKELQEAKDWPGSIAEFERAYSVVPDEVFLLAIAFAYQKWGGHCQETLRGFARYFAACETCKTGDVAKKRWAQAKDQCEVTVTIQTDPPGAALTVDDEGVGAAPYIALMMVGDHRVVASMDGYLSAERPFLLGPVRQQTIDLPLEIASSAQVPRDDLSSESRMRPGWPFWTAVTATVVAGSVGAVLGLLASSGADTRGQITDPAAYEASDRVVQNRALGANVAFGVAGVAALSAIGLYVSR